MSCMCSYYFQRRICHRSFLLSAVACSIHATSGSITGIIKWWSPLEISKPCNKKAEFSYYTSPSLVPSFKMGRSMPNLLICTTFVGHPHRVQQKEDFPTNGVSRPWHLGRRVTGISVFSGILLAEEIYIQPKLYIKVFHHVPTSPPTQAGAGMSMKLSIGKIGPSFWGCWHPQALLHNCLTPIHIMLKDWEYFKCRSSWGIRIQFCCHENTCDTK